MQPDTRLSRSLQALLPLFEPSLARRNGLYFHAEGTNLIDVVKCV